MDGSGLSESMRTFLLGASVAHKATALSNTRVTDGTPSLPREMCWKSRVVSIANESDQVT